MFSCNRGLWSVNLSYCDEIDAHTFNWDMPDKTIYHCSFLPRKWVKQQNLSFNVILHNFRYA